MEDQSLALQLLGPVRVAVGSTPRSPSSARGRSAIAALALHPGEHVSAAALATWMWGDSDAMADHPAAAIHTCVSRLRRFIDADSQGSGSFRLDTVPGGYVLVAAPDQVDAIRFERALGGARTLIAESRLDEAARELEAALRLWSGQALADVTPTPPAVSAASKLNELHLIGNEMLCDIQVRRGFPETVVGELAALTAEHPLRESLAGKYMLALYRCGDRHGALNVYTDMFNRLRDELGVVPSRAMSDLHTEILRDAADGRARMSAPGPEHGPGTLSQHALSGYALSGCALPVMPQAVLPRRAEMALLDRAIQESSGGMPSVAVITGPPGVGKTTVAVQYVMRCRADYSDGAYFVSMSDYAADDRGVGEALGGLLAQLGATSIPGSPAARLARYRELMAGRRATVIIDGAVSADQARMFIAGDRACYLVTSVRQLHDLADTSRIVQIARLSDEDAKWLLNELAGCTRTATSADVATLIGFCEGLPLTIKIVAAHIATSCYSDVRAAIAALRDPRRRLHDLEYGKLSVSGSFMKGTAVCGSAEILALSQLARHIPVAASTAELERAVGPVLADQPVTALRAIRGLIQANLLEIQKHVRDGSPTFAMSALCRAFACDASFLGKPTPPMLVRRPRDPRAVALA